MRFAGKGSFGESFFYALHIRKANPTPCICATLSRLSVPRGKPRTAPKRYRHKRKLPCPKRLPPKAATRRGERKMGAGASLRASALSCVSPPATPSAGRVILGQAARSFCGLPPRTNTLLQPSGGRASRFALAGKPYPHTAPSARPPPGRTKDERRKEAQAIAKQHITTLYPRDIRALSALARCGYVTADQLRENGLRDKRINSYCKDGLVERITHSRSGDREADRECFRLSKAGRDLCREELSCRLYNAQNPAHDLCLSDRYHAISPEERATWKTESECRDIFTEHIQQLRDQGEEERAQELWDMYQDGRLSMPDAIYTRSDGVTVAYEVITNHYGEAEISAKEEAAEALGATIEYCTA